MRKGSSTGNTELIQVKVSKSMKQMLQDYAESHHTTVGEITRQQYRLLIARSLSEQGERASVA